MSSNKPAQITCRAFLSSSYPEELFLSMTVDYYSLSRNIKIFPQETTVYTGSVPNSYFEDIDFDGYQILCDVKTSTAYYTNLSYVVQTERSKKVFSSKEFMYQFLSMAIAQGDTVFNYGDIMHCYVVLPTGTILYFDVILIISAAIDVGVPADLVVQSRLKREFTRKHYDLINTIYEDSDIKGFAHSNGIPMDDVIETVRTGDVYMPYQEIIDTLDRKPFDEFLNPSTTRPSDAIKTQHKDDMLWKHGGNDWTRVRYKKRYSQPGPAAYLRSMMGSMYRYFWKDRLNQTHGDALVKPSESLQEYVIDSITLPLKTGNAIVEAFARYGLVAVDKYMGYHESDILRTSDMATDFANLATAFSMFGAAMIPGSFATKTGAAFLQGAYTKAFLQLDKSVVDSGLRSAIRFFQGNKEGYGNPGDYPYLDMAIDGLLGDSYAARAFMGATTSLGTVLTLKALLKGMTWAQAGSFMFARHNSEYNAVRDLMYGDNEGGMLKYVDNSLESFYNLRPDLNHMRDRVNMLAVQGRDRVLELGYDGFQEAKDAGIQLYQNAEKQVYQLSQAAQYMMSREPLKFIQGYSVLASNIDRIQSSIEKVFKRKADFRVVEYGEQLVNLYDKTKEVSKMFEKAKQAAQQILKRQEQLENNPNPYNKENQLLQRGVERNEQVLLEMSNQLIQGHAELMLGVEEFRQYRDDNFYENDFAEADRFYDANDQFNDRALQAVPVIAGAAAVGIDELLLQRNRAPARQRPMLHGFRRAAVSAIAAGLASFLVKSTSSGKQATAPYAHTNTTFTYQSPNVTNITYPTNTTVPQLKKRDLKQMLKDTYADNKGFIDVALGTTAAFGTGYLAYNFIKSDAEGSSEPTTLVRNVEEILESVKPAVNTLRWERASRIKRGEHDFKTYSKRFYKLLREKEEEEMKRRKRKNRFAIYY